MSKILESQELSGVRKESRGIKKRLHLDFHNHPTVNAVGKNLTFEGFCDCLRQFELDSVVLFAKCHHGLSYYPTSVGVRHPGMVQDVLSVQTQACEALGIEYHLYLSVLRDNHAADTHPEWRAFGPDGEPSSSRDEYRHVCLNTPYYDYLTHQISELLKQYPGAEGIWLDIVRYPYGACYCADCRRDAHSSGLPIQEFNQRMLLENYRKIHALVHASGKKLTLNSTVFLGNNEWRSLSMLEIESILAHVGPFHFPLYSRYLNRCPGEKYGITHSFFQNWREFGTVKDRAQMRYEICQMAFANFGVSLGDELEPDGTFDTRRFAALKGGYQLVDSLNEVCDFALAPIPEIALVASKVESIEHDGRDADNRDLFVRGGVKALLEAHYQIAVIDADEDFSPYEVVLMPADALERDGVTHRLEKYLENDGRAIIFGSAGPRGLDWMGLERVRTGHASYQFLEVYPNDRQLIKTRGEVLRSADGSFTPLLMSYLPYGEDVLGDNESAHIRPVDADTAFASVFTHQSGRLIYSTPDIITQYYTWSDRTYRELLTKLIEVVYDRPLVSGEIPASTQVSLYGDDMVRELRILDCALKCESTLPAQQEEYELVRNYRLKIRWDKPVTKVYDCVTSTEFEFALHDGVVIVDVRAKTPFVVLRLT